MRTLSAFNSLVTAVADRGGGLNHYAPNRHDTGSTSPRSVGEVALIRDTISHYLPVLIASCQINFLAPASRKKERIAGEGRAALGFNGAVNCVRPDMPALSLRAGVHAESIPCSHSVASGPRRSGRGRPRMPGRRSRAPSADSLDHGRFGGRRFWPCAGASP